MKKIVVTGAGGFIGHHLVKKLALESYSHVVGIDLKYPLYESTFADEFIIGDLRDPSVALRHIRDCDEIYALAADMGGMGFIHSEECNILRNNALININTIDAAVAANVPRYFFSSSVCVYRDMQSDEGELNESDVIPAAPDNEYGWEKLYAERILMSYGRKYPMKVRIARFENCYGPLGTWQGGREKAPAAICRKVAEATDGGSIEVWGDGTAIRVFTYVDDLVDGIVTLTRSNVEGPTNLGRDERMTIADLAAEIIYVSGKQLDISYVDGPVGVHSRNFSKSRIHSLGWEPRVSFEDGIMQTYKWVEKQVNLKLGDWR